MLEALLEALLLQQGHPGQGRSEVCAHERYGATAQRRSWHPSGVPAVKVHQRPQVHFASSPSLRDVVSELLAFGAGCALTSGWCMQMVWGNDSGGFLAM